MVEKGKEKTRKKMVERIGGIGYRTWGFYMLRRKFCWTIESGVFQ